MTHVFFEWTAKYDII